MTHPLWWLCLALLLLNDHWLKGSGIVAPWLTGKLSDVAGLVVAPAVLVGLLGARGLAARLACIAVLTLVFTAINLSHAASSLLVEGLALIGVGWRLWPDPADLWALAALPLAAWLTEPVRPRRHTLARLALLPALAACLASSSDEDDKPGGSGRSANLENGTDDPLVVVFASTDGVGGCDLYTEDRVSILTEDAFVHSEERMLDPGDRVALSERGDCAAARIQLPDGDEVRIFWRDLDELEGLLPADDDRRVARTVIVKGETDNWRFEIGDDLTEYDPTRRPPDPNCPEALVEPALDWTPLPVAQGFLVLEVVDEASDGCLTLEWSMPDGAAAPDAGMAAVQSLCVPAWAFPFESGDLVSVVEQRDGPARTLRVSRYLEDGELDVQLSVFHEVESFDDEAFADLTPIECFGELSACGAYVRPVEIELRDGQELAPGEESDLSEGKGRTAQVLIGPAFDIGWTGRECDGGEAQTGTRASALVLRRF